MRRRSAGQPLNPRASASMECLSSAARGEPRAVDLAVVGVALLGQRHRDQRLLVVGAADRTARIGDLGRRGHEEGRVIGAGRHVAAARDLGRGLLGRMQQRHAEAAVGGRHDRLLIEAHRAGLGVVGGGDEIPDFAQQRLAAGDLADRGAVADAEREAAVVVDEEAVAGVVHPLGQDALAALGRRGREDEGLDGEARHGHALVVRHDHVRAAVDLLVAPRAGTVERRADLFFLVARPVGIGVAVNEADELGLVVFVVSEFT